MASLLPRHQGRAGVLFGFQPPPEYQAPRSGQEPNGFIVALSGPPAQPACVRRAASRIILLIGNAGRLGGAAGLPESN